MELNINKNTASTVYINTAATSFATFCYTAKGDLFLRSDWGNFYYSWGAFGNYFEGFLSELEPQYLYNKLLNVREERLTKKQKDVLLTLCDLFITALRENMQSEISEIVLKAQFLDECQDFTSWLKNMSAYVQKYGILQKIVSVDNNGFYTTGYDLKNTHKDKVYPVKTYLLIRDVQMPSPFEPHSKN